MPIAAAVAAASAATSATNASAASPHNHEQPSQDLASALAEVARLKKKLEHSERDWKAQLDLADKRVLVTGGQTVIDEEDRRQSHHGEGGFEGARTSEVVSNAPNLHNMLAGDAQEMEPRA